MYGLAVMLSISRLTTSKIIDEIVYPNFQLIFFVCMLPSSLKGVRSYAWLNRHIKVIQKTLALVKFQFTKNLIVSRFSYSQFFQKTNEKIA